MKKYSVRIDETAIEGLLDIFLSLWDFPESEEHARSCIDELEAYCFGLDLFPHRGTKREDLYPGLYMTHYRGNIRIGYFVDDDKAEVSIILIEPVKKNLTGAMLMDKLS